MLTSRTFGTTRLLSLTFKIHDSKYLFYILDQMSRASARPVSRCKIVSKRLTIISLNELPGDRHLDTGTSPDRLLTSSISVSTPVPPHGAGDQEVVTVGNNRSTVSDGLGGIVWMAMSRPLHRGPSTAATELYRRSISSAHRPIGAELERMVITEGLLMEVVSIVTQGPLNPFYSVVKDEF
jgi:hypothetical protein